MIRFLKQLGIKGRSVLFVAFLLVLFLFPFLNLSTSPAKAACIESQNGQISATDDFSNSGFANATTPGSIQTVLGAVLHIDASAGANAGSIVTLYYPNGRSISSPVDPSLNASFLVDSDPIGAGGSNITLQKNSN